MEFDTLDDFWMWVGDVDDSITVSWSWMVLSSSSVLLVILINILVFLCEFALS